MIDSYGLPAIQVDAKQEELQNEQEQSSEHAERRLPLDVFVGLDC